MQSFFLIEKDILLILVIIFSDRIIAMCGDYYIGGRRFSSLSDLIGYYSHVSCLLKGEKLLFPVAPPEVCIFYIWMWIFIYLKLTEVNQFGIVVKYQVGNLEIMSSTLAQRQLDNLIGSHTFSIRKQTISKHLVKKATVAMSQYWFMGQKEYIELRNWKSLFQDSQLCCPFLEDLNVIPI